MNIIKSSHKAGDSFPDGASNTFLGNDLPECYVFDDAIEIAEENELYDVTQSNEASQEELAITEMNEVEIFEADPYENIICTSEIGKDEEITIAEKSETPADNVSELDEWLKEVNPNYDPYDINSPYCNNCGSCAYAVYRRLEGDSSICATAENIPYNDQMAEMTGLAFESLSPQDIEQRLLEQGDGAHAIIGIDRAEGPGHWFNAACIDGKVVAIDGQSGEVFDWPPDYGDVVNWDMSVELQKEI